jgi:hypothetical protein
MKEETLKRTNDLWIEIQAKLTAANNLIEQIKERLD